MIVISCRVGSICARLAYMIHFPYEPGNRVYAQVAEEHANRVDVEADLRRAVETQEHTREIRQDADPADGLVVANRRLQSGQGSPRLRRDSEEDVVSR